MIRYRTILDRNRNKSCRIHSGISSPPTATLCIILMTQYTPYHLISSDEKKSKWKFFTFWQFVFARWSSLQACWAFRINLRILHIYFPNRIHNSKVSFNFSRQPDFSFVVFPLQDIHIRKIIWLVKRSVTSHGNSPKWNPSLSLNVMVLSTNEISSFV